MNLNLFSPFEISKKEHGAASTRILARLGPTWAMSPVRRLGQSLFLIIFLGLFFYVCWPYGSPDYVATLKAKEIIPAETFLALDPLVPISTALAARKWVWVPPWTHFILWFSILFPRAFCGWLCPLGTLVDVFDWGVGRWVRKRFGQGRGGWVHLRYYVLAATLVAALGGVLISGFLAAIPLVTRGMAFIFGSLQLGVLKGWYLIPPMNAGPSVSMALFVAVFALGLIRPRFWCRHVCPTGALFSACNVLRLTERKVESSCIGCGKCVTACPFDAIKPDYTTRTGDCTLCQTCGGACPVGAIQFRARWERGRFVVPTSVGLLGNSLGARNCESQSPTEVGTTNPPEVSLSRRGFVAGIAGGVVAVAGMQTLFGARIGIPAAFLPVRPPGSVPEQEFLQLCIRCGECFQVCPNNVLQPVWLEQGLEGMWTPQVVARWSACEPKCNNCGQVCPTGAIRPLPIEEKRVARIGLAIVNEKTCLPFAGREACQMCYDECKSAGYDAIEFRRVGVVVDKDGNPVEDSGFLVPIVLADQCNGCGLCETRCYKINVLEKRLIDDTAIHVVAGEGNEDRLWNGSYRALREEERRAKLKASNTSSTAPPTGNDYLPDFLK